MLSQPITEMAGLLGQEVGCSEWITLDQDRFNRFAEATDDYSAVHLDKEAARQAGFDDTFAQGFLTLSMLMRLQEGVVPEPKGLKSGFNYGFDRIRFLSPVGNGARVRGRFSLRDLEEVRPGHWRRTLGVAVEIEGQEKPALTAEWIGYYIV